MRSQLGRFLLIAACVLYCLSLALPALISNSKPPLSWDVEYRTTYGIGALISAIVGLQYYTLANIGFPVSAVFLGRQRPQLALATAMIGLLIALSVMFRYDPDAPWIPAQTFNVSHHYRVKQFLPGYYAWAGSFFVLIAASLSELLNRGRSTPASDPNIDRQDVNA